MKSMNCSTIYFMFMVVTTLIRDDGPALKITIVPTTHDSDMRTCPPDTWLNQSQATLSWDNPMSLEMRGHLPCPGTYPGHVQDMSRTFPSKFDRGGQANHFPRIKSISSELVMNNNELSVWICKLDKGMTIFDCIYWWCLLDFDWFVLGRIERGGNSQLSFILELV
jgi:hypothetical protein